MTKRWTMGLVMVVGAIGGGEAWAVCPNAATTCNSVCYQASSLIYECDLTANGDNQGGVIYAAYLNGNNTCSAGQPYCAYGTDANGTNFCCEFTVGGSTSQFTIKGGDHADTIAFQFSTFDMAPFTAQNLKGAAYGGAGGDDIDGSRYNATNYYLEYLYGNEDDDLIYGWAGKDVITGSEGDDVIYGGDDNDDIAGHDGADEIYGGYGDDIVCGDDVNGADLIYGEAGDDTLWGNDSSDTVDGGSGPDTCDNTGTTLNCTTVGTFARPCTL